MAELFKNLYNDQFFDFFTGVILKIKPDFDKKAFIDAIYDEGWEEKELKQRMRHISITLNQFLTTDFKENLAIVLSMIQYLKKNGYSEGSIEYMFFPDYIEIFGLEDYTTSMQAFEKITSFTSCEFAVRPFILKYPEKAIARMEKWSKHQNEHVRRLASEGCRPRLPWAMALPPLKQDPSVILPILENLKEDPSEYVRRSVANNLNDIAKDNPEVVVHLAKSWKGISKETDWLVKHACRTLLKQGNHEMMELFGFGKVDKIKVESFNVLTPKVKIGGYAEFQFELINESSESTKIRLEYGLYYQKANGTLSKKVFKISEKDYASHSTTMITRKQSFKVITTRKFHVGLHQVSIIINGKEFDKLDFHLTNA